MYQHDLRDRIQEDERKRAEEETFWNVFGIPLFILAVVVGGIIGLVIWLV